MILPSKLEWKFSTIKLIHFILVGKKVNKLKSKTEIKLKAFAENLECQFIEKQNGYLLKSDKKIFCHLTKSIMSSQLIRKSKNYI
jgi:hypothetical protein